MRVLRLEPRAIATASGMASRVQHVAMAILASYGPAAVLAPGRSAGSLR
jgi:hypothetical protein